MKAMVLAAGLGTRLRPLTNDRPKALVEIAGRTLLEITLIRLRTFGIREVIVNVHHFADLVVAYLKGHDNFGMRIEVSREDVLLDTGGGLKKAGWFFLEDSSRGDEFLLHNVDVISTIDFARMVQAHKANQALATLAREPDIVAGARGRFARARPFVYLASPHPTVVEHAAAPQRFLDRECLVEIDHDPDGAGHALFHRVQRCDVLFQRRIAETQFQCAKSAGE